jgi:hypothetical protein
MKTIILKRSFLILIVTILVGSSSFAQFDSAKFTAGNSFQFVMPMGDFGDHHDNGYGIYGNVNYDISDFLTARFDLGWNKVGGSDVTIDSYDYTKQTLAKSSDGYSYDDYSFWEITAGLRANIGIFYVEGRAGYFSGHHGGFGFVPAVGVKFKKFDFQANYAIVSDASFVGLRIGYYWLPL